ncbi:hypothetical protein FQR65_LT19263 [Abscondita terminalis]|nr:hypothetical protein FQR65_LT19263 [Abscondita terminalis]
MSEILDKLPQLQDKYRPTPWLTNTHAHLLYFDLIKKKTVKLQYDRIDQITMQDGGITAIAWYGYDLPEETPTIVIMHTITGTPESMPWNLFGVDICQVRFVGRYLGEQGLDTPFKAAFAMCPGYDTEIGFENVHPFYTKVMTKKLFKAFITPYTQTLTPVHSVQNVLRTKTLQEFQTEYFEMAGFSDYESYSKATNPIYVFENVKIPLMILNAEDDPVCSIKNLEPYKETIQNMDNVVVVTTKKGSHCGFYEGLNTKSWASRLMARLSKTVFSIVNLLKKPYCKISFLLITKMNVINILFDDLKLALPRFTSNLKFFLRRRLTHFSEMKSDKKLSSNRVLALQTKQCFVFAHIPPLNMATSMSPHDSTTTYDSKGQNK